MDRLILRSGVWGIDLPPSSPVAISVITSTTAKLSGTSRSNINSTTVKEKPFYVLSAVIVYISPQQIGTDDSIHYFDSGTVMLLLFFF